MQPGRAQTSGLGVPLLPLARWVSRVAPVCPTHGVLVLSCPSSPLCARFPGPLGSCSPVCSRCLLCRVCGVLGHLAPVNRCARSVPCVARAVSRAPWRPLTGVPAECVVLRVWCPGPLGSCSPVRLLRVLLCVRGVLGHLAPVHRCARAVFCFVFAVSWATWLLFTGVPARCRALCVRCPGPLGGRSPGCPLSVLCCVCGVLGHLAPVHRCACSVCCFACAVSWVTWLLFTGVPALSFVLFLRCPGPLGSCSPVCPRGLLCCVCGVLGHLAPVHCCVRSVCCVACVASWAPWPALTGVPARCVACAVPWATWLLFTGALARCVALRARCPGPLGSCLPVCQAVVSPPFVALGARACAVSWPS